MRALKFFLRMWGFIVGMVLTFAALPVGECKVAVDDIRSAFIEEVEEINKTTYVIGHTCPDSDTVCSAIAYANYKKQLNFNCEPRISGEINKESDFILKYFDVETPKILKNVAGENIILVDHNISAQAVKGIDNANVIEIIDHHNLFGDIKTKNAFYMRMPVGCTATIVWLRYRQDKVPIDKKMAGLMFGAILSDTDNLRSTNTTNLDIEAADNLQKIAAIDDRNKFFLDMESDFTNYDGINERDKIKMRLDDFMKNFFASQNLDMFFIKIHEIENYSAVMLAYGAGAIEILSSALNLSDKNNLLLEKNLPNKKIVRELTATLENRRLAA